MDAGLRDALGRSACTLTNLVSVESPTAFDRIQLMLTGTSIRSPLKCFLCDDVNEVDDNAHVKICPATAQHRTLRFLRMAEVMASIGDTMHHDPSLRPSIRALQDVDVKHLPSGIQVAPFHEQTPKHTFPQNIIPPHSQDTARRFGVWDCGPGHQRTLRAIVLAGRAHIIADLAVQFALQVDIAHVFTMTVSHVSTHPGLYEYVRITPPALQCGWFVNLTSPTKPSPPQRRASIPPPLNTHTSPRCPHSFGEYRFALGTKPDARPLLKTSSRIPPHFPTAFLVSLNFPAVTSVVRCGNPVLPQVLCDHSTGAHSSLGRRVSRPPIESPHSPGSVTARTHRQARCDALTHVPKQVLPRGDGDGVARIP